MLYVPVTILGWEADEPQPGRVRCALVDADGRWHPFVEKVPIVSDEALEPGGPWPRAGVIAVRALGCVGGQVRVDTGEPWGLASMEGETRFTVDTLALGFVTLCLPTAEDPACSFFEDLAERFGVVTNADALARLRAAWRGSPGRLDFDAEAGGVAVSGPKDAVARAAALVNSLAGKPVPDADLEDLRAVLATVRRPRAAPWRVGDVFALPLSDGSWAFGQVLWEQTFAAGSGLRAPTCALFDHRAGAPEADLLEVLTARTVAILHVSSRHLDRGAWRVIGHHPPVNAPFSGPHGEPGNGGTSWDGLHLLAEAWHGLAPWNAWAVPYERALMPGVVAPPGAWMLTPEEVEAWRRGEPTARPVR